MDLLHKRTVCRAARRDILGAPSSSQMSSPAEGRPPRRAVFCFCEAMTKSDYVDLLVTWLAAEVPDLPLPITEYRFAPPRRWRFDLAWVDQKVAVEVDGAVWVGGRHTRGSGAMGDYEKYEAALQLGWRVYRVPSTWLQNKDAMILREEILVTLRILLGRA